MRTHLALVFSSLALSAVGCASAPPKDVPVGPPRGAPLAAAVVGEWQGVAEDGTTTTEGVTLSLRADGTYSIEAGIVIMDHVWKVLDDLVLLEQDPNDELAEGGICFRATAITAARIQGRWAYSNSDDECDDSWYPVTLERASP